MPEPNHTPQRLMKPAPGRFPWKPPLFAAAAVVCLCLIMAPSMGRTATSEVPGPQPAPAPELLAATPAPTPKPAPTPTPSPTPAPEPTPQPYNYAQPVPAGEAAELSWFDDAVFIGASRTDGLRLYSGIQGADFLCYKGVTVFNVMDRERQYIKLDGKKYSFLDALALKQYAKVYISLGINELGYYNDEGFRDEYAAFLDAVREIQPGAQIYIQRLIPVNPEKCKSSKQADWLTNERIALYNGIISQLAEDKQVYLLDPGEAMVDGQGEMPYEATVDGLHFKREWYKKWLDYLLAHTVALEGVN